MTPHHMCLQTDAPRSPHLEKYSLEHLRNTFHTPAATIGGVWPTSGRCGRKRVNFGRSGPMLTTTSAQVWPTAPSVGHTGLTPAQVCPKLCQCCPNLAGRNTDRLGENTDLRLASTHTTQYQQVHDHGDEQGGHQTQANDASPANACLRSRSRSPASERRRRGVKQS